LIYGTEGVGKSTFAAQADSPVFIQTEDGLSEIECDKFPLATEYMDVVHAIASLLSEDHSYGTVVIDSVDWLERLIWLHVVKTRSKEAIKSIEDIGYGKGYIFAAEIWKELLDGLNALRDQRKMAVICIAHAKVEKFDDPEHAPYDRYSPRLHKHSSALITEWADAVLFATRKMRVSKEDVGFNKERTIAKPIGKDGGDRILRCIGGPACIAKNRYGLPEEIQLDWNAFVSHLTQREK
jgi:hypothetical protein